MLMSPASVKELILNETKQLFTDDTFDKRLAVKEIVGDIPDREKFNKAQQLVIHKRENESYPGALRPAYESALLTREQERHLFRKFNYYKYRSLKELESRHIKRAYDFIKKAMEVRANIVECNVRLAVGIIRFDGFNEDSLSEIYLTLIRAVNYFDWRRGLKFSTYATWSLRRDAGRIKHKAYNSRKNLTTLDDAEEILEGHDDGYDREVLAKKLKARVRHYLNLLPDRDQTILKMRFGIDCETATLEQIGDSMGVSKERIRQVQDRAMGRLVQLGLKSEV